MVGHPHLGPVGECLSQRWVPEGLTRQCRLIANAPHDEDIGVGGQQRLQGKLARSEEPQFAGESSEARRLDRRVRQRVLARGVSVRPIEDGQRPETGLLCAEERELAVELGYQCLASCRFADGFGDGPEVRPNVASSLMANLPASSFCPLTR